MELCCRRRNLHGPASAWDERTESAQKEYMDPGIWEIFVNYKDPDGYYFLAAELEGK